MDDVLSEMGIRREHIIAVQEAYTNTNKKLSKRRAERLLELLTILKHYDQKRGDLVWEE